MGRHTEPHNNSKIVKTARLVNVYTILLTALLVLVILGVIFGINVFTGSEPEIMAPGPVSDPYGTEVIG